MGKGEPIEIERGGDAMAAARDDAARACATCKDYLAPGRAAFQSKTGFEKKWAR